MGHWPDTLESTSNQEAVPPPITSSSTLPTHQSYPGPPDVIERRPAQQSIDPTMQGLRKCVGHKNTHVRVMPHLKKRIGHLLPPTDPTKTAIGTHTLQSRCQRLPPSIHKMPLPPKASTLNPPSKLATTHYISLPTSTPTLKPPRKLATTSPLSLSPDPPAQILKHHHYCTCIYCSTTTI